MRAVFALGNGCGYFVFRCFLLSLALGLAGCGRGSMEIQQPSGQRAAHLSGQIPALSSSLGLELGAGLPALSALRGGSEISEQLSMGKAAFKRSTTTALSGNSLLLQPGEGLDAWAVYRFNPLQPLDSIKVQLDAPVGAYVAVSNYGTGRWDIQGPFSADALLPLAGGSYLSAFGEFFVAVLAAQPATVYSLMLRLDNPDSGGLSAQLQVLPGSVTKGTEVYLDASLSFDPNGGIVSYDWDTDGDGSFESSSGAEPQLHFSPLAAGAFSVAVRVTDNDGASAYDSAVLHVHGFLPSQTVDGEGERGQYNSMQLVNGQPAIAYYDSTQGDLLYRRALDSQGREWAAAQSLDSTSQAGQFCSLAVIGNRPAVAYYHGTNNELRFIRASDANGDDWQPRTTVDSDGDIGKFCSLVGGGSNSALPMIACYQDGVEDLLFYRGISTAGTSWTQPELVDAEGNAGRYPELLLVDGQPAIAYIGENNTLHYVRAGDLNGANWPVPLELDNSLGSLNYLSMALIGGYPAISYDAPGQRLGFIMASDVDGEAWRAPQKLDLNSTYGLHSSLQEVDGRAAIAYTCFDPASLRYIQAEQADASSWAEPQVVFDLQDFAGYMPSMLVLDDGLPALSFNDPYNNDDLLFSRWF